MVLVYVLNGVSDRMPPCVTHILNWCFVSVCSVCFASLYLVCDEFENGVWDVCLI